MSQIFTVVKNGMGRRLIRLRSGNVLEDRTKGSENPGFKSFLRILIGIGTALRIGGKD